MKIGYVSTHLSLGCTSARTFRLASYTPDRFRETVGNNLLCLLTTLRTNVDHGLLFFRLTSDLVPFASHPVQAVPWQAEFAPQLARIGDFIRAHGLRVSMHPGQYTLVNSPNEATFANSVAELAYHADVLDGMGLDATHKIQLHVGGVYGDKAASLDRFVERFSLLPESVRRRLAVENDDRLYTVRDALWLYERVGTPVIFDNFHHTLNNSGETVRDGLALAHATWGEADGTPICDYSSQEPGARAGNHAARIDEGHFRAFLNAARGYDVDVMLEIKDKNVSALKALSIARERAVPAEGRTASTPETSGVRRSGLSRR